ncbi:MAG TPA: hypothetical protein VMH03_08505 [Terriglobales bacterium]|nr:hypothetical protein [Terriglobales bacterium]
MKLHRIVVLFGMATLGGMLMGADDAATTISTEAQVAQLEQLHAAFHRAASVRNIVTGDSQEVIDQRIRQILSLWTKDAVLKLNTGSPFDGYYIGRGTQGDSSTCPMPSNNPANQGTLCTLYTYVAGSFQSENKFISLTSAFKRHFNIIGNTARFYFECHYFDVDSSMGPPPWTAVSHVALTGTAIKVNGQWKFWHATAPKVGVPAPGSAY